MKIAILAILLLTLHSTVSYAEDDIEKYTKAIAENPKDAVAYFLRGYSKEELTFYKPLEVTLWALVG